MCVALARVMEQKNVNVHFAISFLKERLCQMKEYDKRFIEKNHSNTVYLSRGRLHISPSKMTSFSPVYVISTICNDYISHREWRNSDEKREGLTLNPLTWKIWWAPNNTSRWQMGFNSAFKGLIILSHNPTGIHLHKTGHHILINTYPTYV
jgi:hypothetical protein